MLSRGGSFRRRMRTKTMWKINAEDVLAGGLAALIIIVAMEMLCWAVTGSYIGR